MPSSDRDAFEMALAASLGSLPRPRLTQDFEQRLRARRVRTEPAAARRVPQVPTLPARTRMLLRLYFMIATLASLLIVAATELPTSLSPIAGASILVTLAFSLTPLWMMRKACPRFLELILRTVR